MKSLLMFAAGANAAWAVDALGRSNHLEAAWCVACFGILLLAAATKDARDELRRVRGGR